MPRYIKVLKKKKIISNAEEMKKYFKDFNPIIKVKNHNVELFIVNPKAKDRDIKICFTKHETVFYFSYQHAHFGSNDLKDLIDYIESFLTNRIAAVELFDGEWDYCGGSREYSGIHWSTAESIASLFSESYLDLLLEFKNNQWKFYVQCWDPSMDKAISIQWDGYHYSLTEIGQ